MTVTSSGSSDLNTVKPPRVIASSDLFKGEREVIIRHQSQDYRLLITKSGKLILNK